MAKSHRETPMGTRVRIRAMSTSTGSDFWDAPHEAGLDGEPKRQRQESAQTIGWQQTNKLGRLLCGRTRKGREISDLGRLKRTQPIGESVQYCIEISCEPVRPHEGCGTGLRLRAHLLSTEESLLGFKTWTCNSKSSMRWSGQRVGRVFFRPTK